MGVSTVYRRNYDTLGWASTSKTLTFSNTSTAQNLFTVTGDVIIKIIAVCTTNVASAAAGAVAVGTAITTSGVIAETTGTDLDAREIWHDSSPDSELEAFSTMREYIVTDGNDITLTPTAQIDSGVVVFYCYWIPLSSDGEVTAA
jgi:hypothetical protein